VSEVCHGDGFLLAFPFAHLLRFPWHFPHHHKSAAKVPKKTVISANAGIEYAAGFRFHHWHLGIPDHPLSRVTTPTASRGH
jgi:hypothetical protein